MTIKDARKALAYWQDVLNLPEWSISVRLASHDQLRKTACATDALATTPYSAEEMTAEILLQRGVKHTEQTIIHELLHIVLEGHRPMNGRYSELQERAINRIADGLLRLKR